MGRLLSLIGALFFIMTASSTEAKDLENQLYIDLKDGRVVIDLRPDLAPVSYTHLTLPTNREG